MEKTITYPTFRHEWKHLITWEDMLTLRIWYYGGHQNAGIRRKAV